MPASSGKTSCRREIIRVLKENLIADNADDFMTAAEIRLRISGYSLSTVSSVLARMAKSGTLFRAKGVGPRGGYGYCLGAIL